VGDEHRTEFARVEAAGFERGERGGAAVQQDRRAVGRTQVNAGLEPATVAEGVTGAREGDGQRARWLVAARVRDVNG
jgi:hypothetical protein